MSQRDSQDHNQQTPSNERDGNDGCEQHVRGMRKRGGTFDRDLDTTFQTCGPSSVSNVYVDLGMHEAASGCERLGVLTFHRAPCTV